MLTIDDVAMMTGRRVRPVAASLEDLNLLLARLARMDDSIEAIVEDEVEGDDEDDVVVDEADSDAPIIKLVHSIVAQAVQLGASDIHVDPEEGDTRVLFRVDGVLAPAATVKRKMAMRRGLAHQDHGRPGHLREARAAGRPLRADRRRPPRRHARRDAAAGLRRGRRAAHPRQRRDDRRPRLARACPRTPPSSFGAAIKKPNGAVLVTGPTGSGKSTTLYAALNELNDGDRTS